MNSQDLDRLRQARLDQLRSNGGQSNGNGSDAQPNKAQSQQDEMRASVISQVLLPEARERLSRVSLVRPERGRQVEELIVRMAQSGQIRSKVSENELVRLLDQISQQDQQVPKLTINRRTDALNDSDDDYGIGAASGTSRGKGSTGAREDYDNEDDDDDFFD